MRKLLALFIFLTLLAGCEGDSVHRAAERMSNDNSLDKNMVLNAFEAQYGCDVVQDSVERAQRGVSDTGKAKYNCQGDNNTFTSVNEPREKGENIIQTVVKVIMVPFLLLGILVVIQNKSTGNNGIKTNVFIFILENAFNLIVRFKMVSILVFLAIFGLMISKNAQNEILEQKVYREAPIKIPNFSIKTGLALNIFEYQLCIKSNTIPQSNEDAAIRISKIGYGYELKGAYMNCQLDGGFAVDRLGNEIARRYSLLDFETLQERQVRENLAKLIAATDVLATRVAAAEGEVIRRSVPDFLTCENLPTQFSGMEPEDTHNVVMKTLECVSRDFVFNMSRYSGMTEKEIDNLEAKTKGRNVFMCSGEFVKQTGTDLAGIRAKYQACVTQNCNGSGSSYACGVALAKYNSVFPDEEADLLTIPTTGFYEKPINYNSAKMILGTISVKFTMDEEVKPRKQNGMPIASFPSSSAYGRMTYEQTQNFYTRSDLFYSEKHKQNFSVSNLISQLDPGNGGLFGLDKFFACYNQPYSITPEYHNCQDFPSESKILGNTFWASASMLTLGNKLMKKSDARKKEKAEEVAYSAIKGGISVVGISKKVAAGFLPFIYSEGLPVFEDVFEENYQRIMGQRSEYYAAMTCSLLSDACSRTIDTIASILYAASVVFNFVIPLGYLLAFITILTGYFAFIYAKGTLAGPRYAIKYGSDQARNDIDKHDSIIDMENTWLKPLAFVTGFYLSNIFFLIFSLIYIGNPYEFASSILSISLNDLFVAKVVASVVALLTIYISFTACVMMWVNYIASVEHRDGVVTASDGKFQNAAELGRYAKSMTGKGLQ